MNHELQPLLDGWAREAGVPGASVGVLHEGEDSVLTTGVSNVDTGHAVEPGTLFMIGSTSKTFTAAAVLAMVEDGLVDLDEPIVKYLPDLRLADPVARDTVTTRHLLTHSAGFLGDVDFDMGWGPDALAAAALRYGELPQVSGVGEVFSYSRTRSGTTSATASPPWLMTWAFPVRREPAADCGRRRLTSFAGPGSSSPASRRARRRSAMRPGRCCGLRSARRLARSSRSR